MKIIVSEITHDGLELELSEHLDLSDITITEPVKASLSVNRVHSDVMITGVIKAECELQCDRCLQLFTKSLNIAVDVLFKPVLAPTHSGEQYKISADELDIGFYSHDIIEINDLLQEQILLNLPMQHICSENCKGLCPQCGADLNISPCNCSKVVNDDRLSKLSKFL